MENLNENKVISTENVLREKRLQMVNEYAEAVVDYGADHKYPIALQSRFRTFDAFVHEYFGLVWNTKNAEYNKPVLKDSEEEQPNK